MKLAFDTIVARGNRLVTAKHVSTFEVTKENFLSEKGDCIIAISADKSASELSQDLKSLLKDSSIVIIILKSGGEYDVVIAKGSPMLTLSDDTSLVVRRSTYIDGRTIAIEADKAAKDINRELIGRLKKGELLEMIIVAVK
ncbi:MAG: DUF371 domain-containing protein [Thermoprotei archaeon]|nr:MAG: DUF371 domain-containing protein [Thermoprotei archaeon]HDI32057.1 DUF371 domain-containing protein [Thermofilum sp.]